MAEAPPFGAGAAAAATGDSVLVLVDGEARSLPVEVVREVVALGDLTPVPRAPPEVLGVTQVRGQVVPVLDAGAREGSGRAPRSPRSGEPLVLVEVDGVRAALAVERTLGVSAPGVAAAGAPLPLALDVAALLAWVKRRLDDGANGR